MIGIAVARYFYHRGRRFRRRWRRRLKPLHTLLYNKWYVDEIYDFLFVNGLSQGRRARCWRGSTRRWWTAA